MQEERPDLIKHVITSAMDNNEIEFLYFEIYCHWDMLARADEDWLVGKNGIIYKLPEDVWQKLLVKIGPKRISETAKEKIMDRIKANRASQKNKEKEQRKNGQLTDKDKKHLIKKLGYSSNSIFTDKRSTRAGNDPHGYFSSGF